MVGAMCATTFVPGGASGVAAKLKFPKTYAYAESDVLARADRSKFSVMFACGMR